MVEGEGGVTLRVEVREGEIPDGQHVEVTVATTDQSANGVCYNIIMNFDEWNQSLLSHTHYVLYLPCCCSLF